uniref:penicillin acylase family protein n=1 Tax=Aquiflexum sp. TaxID=1872584 RepID=UPI0035939862
MLKRTFSIIAFFCLITASFSQGNLEKWEQRAQNTEIVRDQWGIPHVYGKSDADAVFGMIYAQCEDDFNRIEVNYITAMGRMAEVEGVNQVFADLRMKLYIDEEIVKKEYQNSPQWLKNLMDAWADGINYFL